jgi:hypothetical protein
MQSNLDTAPHFPATCGGTTRVAVNGNRVKYGISVHRLPPAPGAGGAIPSDASGFDFVLKRSCC